MANTTPNEDTVLANGEARKVGYNTTTEHTGIDNAEKKEYNTPRNSIDCTALQRSNNETPNKYEDNATSTSQINATETGINSVENCNEKTPSRWAFIKQLSGSKKLHTLLPVVMGSFLSGTAFSLIAPFYPSVAERKGMDVTTIGVVFGIFELGMFLTSPIFGYSLVKLGPKFVYTAGGFVGSSCYVLFGSLKYCPSATPFIVLSILIRTIAAVGYSAIETSGFAIVSNEFPKNIGVVIGIIKTSTGVGAMLGPTIGAAFYELGGFALPFYVTGGAGLLNTLAVYRLLPSIEHRRSTKRKGSVFSLLRSPMVVIPMCSVAVGMVGLTTYESTFSRHLEPLHLSVGMIGVIFGVFALVYSLMSVVWGYLSDAKNIQGPLIVMGHLIFAVAYFVLGPSNLFPFIPFNIVTTVIGLAGIGISLGCTFVPTMKCMVIGAVELGFEDGIDTYGLVSGLYTCIQTLGGFLGPVGVGYLIQEFDFPVAYTTVAMLNVLVMFISLAFFTFRRLGPNAYKSAKSQSYSNLSNNEDLEARSLSSMRLMS